MAFKTSDAYTKIWFQQAPNEYLQIIAFGQIFTPSGQIASSMRSSPGENVKTLADDMGSFASKLLTTNSQSEYVYNRERKCKFLMSKLV